MLNDIEFAPACAKSDNEIQNLAHQRVCEFQSFSSACILYEQFQHQKR